MIEKTELVKRKEKNIVGIFPNLSNFFQNFCMSGYGKTDIIHISDFYAQNGYIYALRGTLHKTTIHSHLRYLKTRKFSI